MRPGFSCIDRRPINRPRARRTAPSERAIYEGRATGVKPPAEAGFGPLPAFARKRYFIEADQGDLGCPVAFAKIFSFPSDANHLHVLRHPGPHRGAFRDRHGRRAGDAVDADSAKDEGAILRTAKSCGSDAPTLASSFA